MLSNFILLALSGLWAEGGWTASKPSSFSNWLQRQQVQIFLAAGFLVSVPVFIQAPLVRIWPWVSLLLTLVWVGLGLTLLKNRSTQIWGDLLLGFSWSWLAGSIYWGWWRQEPLIHLPLESIGVPFALWGLSRGWLRVGNLFYLGSLLGTAVTDIYFYITELIGYWRQLMQVEPAQVSSLLEEALGQISNLWGLSWAIVLGNILLLLGFLALQKGREDWWAFSGALLSTILVDSLFLLAIFIA